MRRGSEMEHFEEFLEKRYEKIINIFRNVMLESKLPALNTQIVTLTHKNK